MARKPADGTGVAPETKGKPGPKRSRHGRYALKQMVRLKGTRAFDLRTQAGRELVAWEADLVEHLGGDPSAAERLVVQKIVTTELLVQDADRRLLGMASTVTRRNKYVGLVRERQSLVDSQLRLLQSLGLQRRARPAKSLNDVVAEIQARKAAEAAGTAQVEPEDEEASTPAPTVANSARGVSEPRQAGRNEPTEDDLAAEVTVMPASLTPDMGFRF